MSDVTEVGLQPEPSPRRSRGRAAALAVGALAVVGAGAFAAFALSGDEENGPTDPVRALTEALDEGDVLGALEQFEPGERDALRDPIVQLVEELNRLEILEGASLSELEGVEFDFEDLEMESEEVADDIARVTITGGTAIYRADPSELPLGDFVTDLIGDERGEPTSEETTLPAEGAEDDQITTVKRDGTWYVSIGYTTAENARRDSGRSLDDIGPGIEADGADSPEAAVDELLTAATELDVRRMVELLPPGEMGAVQRYSGLFLDDAEDAASDAKGDFEVELGEADYEVRGSGDRRTVLVSIPSFRAAFEEGEVHYEDGCARFDGPDAPNQELCKGDNPFELFEGLGGFGEALEGLEPPKLSITDDPPEIGIVVTEVDGQWYVSPTGTMLEAVVQTLAALEPEDLDAIVAWVQDLQATIMDALTGGGAFPSDSRLELEDDLGSTSTTIG